MRFNYWWAVVILSCMLVAGCSKKHQPQTEAKATEVKAELPAEEKKVVKKTIKTPTPKIITVDDRAAKKAVDGRLYYDLEGHRYWKNFDDGKYYLFNKNMSSNPAFKPH